MDVRTLAERYGTPLYVFDVRTIREAARGFREGLAEHYPSSRVVYAGKAFLVTALIEILVEEDLGLDVVSGGELFAGSLAGMPR